MELPDADLSECPPGLRAYLDREIEADLRRIVPFLTDCGVPDPLALIRQLPFALLFELAAVMRLQAWEDQGHVVHTDAGLPNSPAVLRALAVEVIASVREHRPIRSAVGPRVYDVLIERFSWWVPDAVEGGVRLDVGDLDALASRLAEYLWANRRNFAVSNPRGAG